MKGRYFRVFRMKLKLFIYEELKLKKKNLNQVFRHENKFQGNIYKGL